MGRKTHFRFMNRKKFVARGKRGGRPTKLADESTATRNEVDENRPSQHVFEHPPIDIDQQRTDVSMELELEPEQFSSPQPFVVEDPNLYYSSEDDFTLHFSCSEDEAEDQPTISAAERKISRLGAYFHPDNEAFFMPIHTSIFHRLISSLACPSCKMSSLELSLSYKGGLNYSISLHCECCAEVIFEDYSSPGSKVKDITLNSVIAAKECGLVHVQMCKFFCLLGMEVPLHHKTFQQLAKKVHRASTDAAERCMLRAAGIIRTDSAEINSVSNAAETTVSYDGTWHKRGFSSHTGVGVAIDAKSGFVIDTQTLSNFCLGCEKGPKVHDQSYISWKAAHQCQKNCNTTAAAMETEAAFAIFDRSISSRKLVYSSMLCDGDAKAHEKVKLIYDSEKPVLKEDCVNHISKRMYNNLTKLKSDNKSTLNRKLTKVAIEKITNVYAANLKRSAPDVGQMRLDVQAGIKHMVSTDSSPQHQLCPTGPHSWCFFNRATALGDEPRKHKPTITPLVEKYIQPVVERLTDESLLSRCASMKTQNANECFNSLIWTRCPKVTFGKRDTVETAVALSTLCFNYGPKGILYVYKELNLPINSVLFKYLEKTTDIKIKRGRKSTKRESKWARKQKKRLKVAEEEERETMEGSTYGAGAFNE